MHRRFFVAKDLQSVISMSAFISNVHLHNDKYVQSCICFYITILENRLHVWGVCSDCFSQGTGHYQLHGGHKNGGSQRGVANFQVSLWGSLQFFSWHFPETPPFWPPFLWPPPVFIYKFMFSVGFSKILFMKPKTTEKNYDTPSQKNGVGVLVSSPCP